MRPRQSPPQPGAASVSVMNHTLRKPASPEIIAPGKAAPGKTIPWTLLCLWLGGVLVYLILSLAPTPFRFPNRIVMGPPHPGQDSPFRHLRPVRPGRSPVFPHQTRRGRRHGRSDHNFGRLRIRPVAQPHPGLFPWGLDSQPSRVFLRAPGGSVPDRPLDRQGSKQASPGR